MIFAMARLWRTRWPWIEENLATRAFGVGRATRRSHPLPMNSMTGFGRGASTHGIWQATVELSAVNRKQAEVVIQAPRELTELESRIRKATLEVVSRGRVQLSIQLVRAQSAAGNFQVDAVLAQSFAAAFTTLSEAIGHSVEPVAADFLRQPGIIAAGIGEVDAEAAWLAVGPALTAALVQLATMRESEGAHLKADFLARLDHLLALVYKITAEAPGRMIRQRDLLHKRLRDAGLELDPADERVVKEIALFADRYDVSEEITRLDSHFAKFRDYLDSLEPPGRALDFLCQELFREFNTIGSKANDASIAQTIVEAKTELEKIREQVQNIE